MERYGTGGKLITGISHKWAPEVGKKTRIFKKKGPRSSIEGEIRGTSRPKRATPGKTKTQGTRSRLRVELRRSIL